MSENPLIVAVCAVRALGEIPDPFVRAILDHHKPDDYEWRSSQTVYCQGCDMGCSCEAAEWPCSTVRLIAERYDVDLPETWQANWRDAVNDERNQENP